MGLLRRALYFLPAAAGLAPSAWCAPKQPKRTGVDENGRLKYETEHLKIFGPGFHHDVFWKAKIVQMWEASEEFYEEREKKKKFPSIHEFFHKITGFGHQRVGDYQAEIEENDGYVRLALVAALDVFWTYFFSGLKLDFTNFHE